MAYKVKLRRPKNALITKLFGCLGKVSEPALRTYKLNTKACILFMQCIYLLFAIFYNNLWLFSYTEFTDWFL
jgi:hypothetical protein